MLLTCPVRLWLVGSLHCAKTTEIKPFCGHTEHCSTSTPSSDRMQFWYAFRKAWDAGGMIRQVCHSSNPSSTHTHSGSPPHTHVCAWWVENSKTNIRLDANLSVHETRMASRLAGTARGSSHSRGHLIGRGHDREAQVLSADVVDAHVTDSLPREPVGLRLVRAGRLEERRPQSLCAPNRSTATRVQRLSGQGPP